MEFSGTAPVPLFDAASVFRTSEVHTPEKAIYMLILPGSELGLYSTAAPKKAGWTNDIGNEIGYKKSGQMRSCWHIKIATHLMCYTMGVP